MNVNVLLFAAARDLAGSDVVTVRLTPGSTVGELRARLARDCPPLAELLAKSAVAVNHDFADDSRSLSPNDEIAIIPPVSGG
jgi:molybdopterin converting factor subunit 1